jgi:hypothetical protein
MAQHLVEVVGPQLLPREGIALLACEISETRKCSATYERAPDWTPPPCPSAAVQPDERPRLGFDLAAAEERN